MDIKQIEKVLICSDFTSTYTTQSLKLSKWQGGNEWTRLTPSISIQLQSGSVRVVCGFRDIKRTKFFNLSEIGVENKILGWFFGTLSNELGVTLNKWRDYIQG